MATKREPTSDKRKRRDSAGLSSLSLSSLACVTRLVCVDVTATTTKKTRKKKQKKQTRATLPDDNNDDDPLAWITQSPWFGQLEVAKEEEDVSYDSDSDTSDSDTSDTKRMCPVAYLDEHMPFEAACMWRWTTTEGLRLKRLFDAVAHIVSEGRLMIYSDRLVLVDQPDVNKHIVVGFYLDADALRTSGTYHVHLPDEPIEDHPNFWIPLNIGQWIECLRPINAQSVVGVCVTHSSVRSKMPTLDVYIKTPSAEGCCYQFKLRWMDHEFDYFGKDAPTPMLDTPGSSIELDTPEFKRMLGNLGGHEVRLEYGSTYTEFVPQNVPVPGFDLRVRVSAEQRIECAARVPDAATIECAGCRDGAFGQRDHMGPGGCLSDDSPPPPPPTAPPPPPMVKTGSYSIAKLLRCTRGTKLSRTVVLAFTPDHPLSITYDLKNWGQLCYRVAEEEPDVTVKDGNHGPNGDNNW